MGEPATSPLHIDSCGGASVDLSLPVDTFLERAWDDWGAGFVELRDDSIDTTRCEVASTGARGCLAAIADKPLCPLPVRSLSISGTVRVGGDRPLVLLVHDHLTLRGHLSADAEGAEPGPGGARPGDPAPASAGRGQDAAPCLAPACGGGGGGGAAGAGGPGGCEGGRGGEGWLSGWSDPVAGGGAGGRGGGPEGADGGGMGGGGGVVYLMSPSAVSLIPPGGSITARGGSGEPGVGGGGGGGGGTVIIEAPSISVYGVVDVGGGPGGSAVTAPGGKPSEGGAGGSGGGGGHVALRHGASLSTRDTGGMVPPTDEWLRTPTSCTSSP